MAPSAWPVLLLTAPLLFGLAAAYPHRAYHDEVDAPEKNVRHIDGLGGGQVTLDPARQLEESVRRQVEEQVRATGSGSASGKWSVKKYSEYSSGGGGGASDGTVSSGAPIRATITGEAVDGTDAILGIATNCHNCRMRVRKIGGGSSIGGAEQSSYGAGQSSYGAGQSSYGAGQSSYGAGQSSYGASGVAGGAGHGAGAMQVESSQSRYYSSRSEASGQDGGVQRPVDLGGASSGASRVVQTSRVVQQQQAGGYGSAARTPDPYLRLSDLDTTSSGSSRKETKVTKSSWQLSDLGYGTNNIDDIIRRLDEDMRAGRFQNGKTVTTVTTTTSENGGPPITRQETFVKDGVDVPQIPDHSSGLGLGHGASSAMIGHSEIEDLLRELREDQRSGRTEAGKTVTTVVESSSVNGATPVVKKKTFVRDGFDASALSLDAAGLDAASLDAQAAGFGQSGSRSVSRATQSVWTSGTPIRPQLGPIDHLGGGNLLSNHHKEFRNVTTVSSYGSGSSGGSSHDVRTVDALGGGHLIREADVRGAGSSYDSEVKGTRRVDALGGGHLLRETGSYAPSSSSYGSGSSSSTYKETRRVDALGGGHLIRDTDSSYGVPAAGSDLKGTRRVDALGGGHLIRGTDTASSSRYAGSSSVRESALGPRPTADSLGVSQMPGYRPEGPTDEDVPAYGTGSNSKYYSTFQTSSFTSGGAGGSGLPAAGVVDSGLAGQQAAIGGEDSVVSGSEGSSRTSSSSYKKVVKYSSSGSVATGSERDVDHLGGGHLIRGVPSVPSVQDAGGNQAFIAAEQNGGRIPEAASGSYFSSSSSSYQRAASASSGLNGVNPAAPTGTVVVPVREPASSGSAYGSRTEWADVQETRDDEFPPLRNAAPTSPSIKLGYGSGNGGYGGPAALPVGGSSIGDAASTQRGGKLSTSLLDIGILPSGSSSSQQAETSGYGASGSGYSSSTRYSSSGYGASGSSLGSSGGGYGTSGSRYGASGSEYGTSGSRYGTSGSEYGSSGSSRVSSSSYGSRQSEMVAAPSASQSSWSTSYSSGTPSRTASSYGSSYGTSYGSGYGSQQSAYRERQQRMAQGHGGPDCDGSVKI